MTNWIGYCPNTDCIIDPKFYESEAIEDAIVPLAKANDLLPGEKILIGTQTHYNRLPYDAESLAEDILNQIACTVDEIGGECGEGLDGYVSDDDQSDLVKRVEKMMDEWVAERNIEFHTWEVSDAKEFTIPDYLDDDEEAPPC